MCMRPSRSLLVKFTPCRAATSKWAASVACALLLGALPVETRRASRSANTLRPVSCVGGVGGRTPRRQPVRESAERVQRFDARFAVEDLGRCRLNVGGGKAYAQRFGARRIAQEAHHRQQLGRIGGVQSEAPRLAGAHEPGALAPVVVDLQVE